MQQLIHGNLIHAPALGRLEILEHGWMLLEDGTIRGLWREKPAQYAALPVTDYGNALVMQSFADMHLHAPQYPMLGMGMDLPLLDWLNTYCTPRRRGFLWRSLIALGSRAMSAR